MPSGGSSRQGYAAPSSRLKRDVIGKTQALHGLFQSLGSRPKFAGRYFISVARDVDLRVDFIQLNCCQANCLFCRNKIARERRPETGRNLMMERARRENSSLGRLAEAVDEKALPPGAAPLACSRSSVTSPMMENRKGMGRFIEKLSPSLVD